MNFSQLECFTSLASTLNFVQTAERLGLSQPAVSKQLKALEGELGATLFERTSRTVAITPAGEEFLRHASEMLRLYYSTKEAMGSFGAVRPNRIRIGYADPNLVPLLGTLLRRLSQRMPKVLISPELLRDQTDANLGRLKKSKVDLIIGMRDAKFDDSEIIFRKLNENRFNCVLPLEHPLAGRFAGGGGAGEISTETLWPYRQILAIPPYLLRNFYSRGLRILPVNEDLDNLVCNSADEAYALVGAGLGYAMIPDFLLRRAEGCVAVRWRESPHAPFGIYHRPLKGQGEIVRALVAIIREHFGAQKAGVAGV
ncbi:MAG: LysR family transcriptional regulator [Succinivibrionaceae bacterium]|nr:LysR family transcriptional regulator [Succinivibrionaceae bacterium]